MAKAGSGWDDLKMDLKNYAFRAAALLSSLPFSILFHFFYFLKKIFAYLSNASETWILF